MAAVYSNKFIVENQGTILRIVFVDERAPVKPGIPMASVTATEVVVTRDNAKALGELLVKLAT